VGKEIIDQSAHFTAAFVAVWIMGIAGASMGPFAGLLCGLALGLNREIAQHDTFRIWTLSANSYRDIAFWCAGGLIAGLGA
jgi:hypothetical protein